MTVLTRTKSPHKTQCSRFIQRGGSGAAAAAFAAATDKHQASFYPVLAPSGITADCYNTPCPVASNQCYVKSRHYYQPWTERPSYYLDFTQPFVGGRPVQQANTINAIPRTMIYDTFNLTDRNFYCQQPCWLGSCI